ncbi:MULTISPECIES: YgfZ/GcvT domain-containing protein [Methylorubrum]|jgi:folate-binding protein YgfZ|uniref:Glycine cleavage T protein (Aminomethyl transferase) n=2 Tax=Methylorubrum extorquens TaxID=408 RepID=C5AR56_METEA|nr:MULTISPECIES: folate-binding protein YgfZ [Methylorubrum]ACS42329.1 Glycine cleavage T protein (aminomethyl transferase) [Methylorubrum extorquens AM1]EHP90004.1 folate-binding protein YgfZ [Methylorubrum extorquens DSM 13060]MCP1544617.1 folate-binding protein YgfZ [Methylorubrum extorquens]MCP1588036.1 folate-binding protein YgfZ [Methylorubrum extorquens]BDL41719.1 folate-binding protein [Methylorubrum sp. GM97]
MPIALLPDRTVVAVSGSDALPFLQGILTCNVETLPEGEARLGALLTPQGKIQFDFLVSRSDDGFRLDVAAERVADLVKRLGLYRLRAKVTVAADPTLGVAAAWDGAETAAETVRVRDGRLPALGERLYFAEGAFSADATEDAYHAHRIGLGVPEGGRDFAFGDAFPHEALMDQLGGVDFKKGCYVGQEVVSRMQHRGTARTRILPIVYRDGPAPEPGTEVIAGARSLGVTGSAAGDRGLATIRLDRLGDALAIGEPVRAGGTIAAVAKPEFARFAFPTDTAVAG